MTDRVKIQQTNHKAAMARSLAMLILGIGVLLTVAGWWVHQTTKPSSPSMNELQARAAQPLPSAQAATQAIAMPVPAALPPTANLTLQDKPETLTQYEPPAVTVHPTLPPPPEPPELPAQPQASSATTSPQTPDALEPTTPPSQPVISPTITNAPSINSSEGWIYAGQFIDGTWVERGLVIDAILPVAGQSYALNWGANIRAAPPGKDTALSATIGYLPQGHAVDILQVKKSGSKGHVWLKIKR
ncbi:hypothetical protein [Candidatus Thiothrix anitrata]|jgi:hypothetical protein|uniref:SH3 domain-containing protein n=1 Tax=Candidatus Thiothrix anitrata TaxID=2823902 RepID=A0ABX7X687_9GAMM|nr:hypothetical protein [Candidatus Thiothrix anitrata]QTR50228.1 hypothetical protein J8380_01185 [Candidatus Thiothrix anitrata]